MRKRAGRSPAMRARDVVPAAVAVVLLLAVGGCMGALGGGPLDGPGASSPPASTPAPEPSPSMVWGEEGTEGTEPPEYLFDFAERLRESKRSGKAPDAFSNRKPFFSCGEFVLGQGELVPTSAWDCLAEHLETGAELVEVRPTTEGDPIITYYRVGPEIDGVEYFTDASFDKFGSDAWTHGRCSFEPGGAKVARDTCSSDGELQ